MDSSSGRLNTSASISGHPRFSYDNSISNIVSNDNKNEELSWGLFDFNNGIESPNLNQFFDSPSFLFDSDIISSPTIGNYFGHDFEERKTNVSDLNYRSHTIPMTISRNNKMEEPMKTEVLDWNDKSQPNQIDFSMQSSKIEQEPELELVQSPHKDCKFEPIQASKKQSRYEDGYNWRKYGQKQVKGSQKPRSYFKCSYPNCPTKKKVEKDLNGYVTEVIYKGKHDHPMPQNMKKSLLNSFQNTMFDDHLIDNKRFESFSPNSFVSFGEDEHDHDSSISKSGNDHENEPNAKRWKTDEAESEAISYDHGSKSIQEPRVVIETKSEIDILDDGYKWRKYGQKVVKGNPNPRSYYKCTNTGCRVRKLVERASHDLDSVITTYEGKHNHNVPSHRGSSYATTQPPYKSNTTTTTSKKYVPEKSTPLLDYSYIVHGTRGLPNDSGLAFNDQKLEKSKEFGFLESSYMNQDWMRGEFVSNAKEEPEDDFIYNSF
ncbi:hypothetical protein SSX86_007300 [Deinandra increscens subsp. villosa]|uniref:WRKY domain-containing protein n=1 Tax=Deinandra increscens subsp. villosa TaxID=3103831 RepID=A0AAP0DH97_9ASTR